MIQIVMEFARNLATAYAVAFHNGANMPGLFDDKLNDVLQLFLTLTASG
jgi:hypothetical protein